MAVTEGHRKLAHDVWNLSLRGPEGVQQAVALLADFDREVRLAETLRWKPVGCVRAEHKPLRSPLCDVCQQMARWEERIAELKGNVP